jgi:hypothetical protein
MKMKNKDQLIESLRGEFDKWESLINGLYEDKVCNPLYPSTLSVKDEVAHLWAWQKISIARAEAVLSAKDPVYPKWPEGLDPDVDDDLDKINAWIFSTCHDLTWPEVYQNWRNGFLHFLEMGEKVLETEMFTFELFPWMAGYSFSQVLIGSYNHHQEHRERIQIWFKEHGMEMKA